MAKIGSGVDPEVKERFKLLRMLGFNKKKEPVKTKTEEERIQEIATTAYKTADFSAIKKSFEIGVEEAKRKHDAEPTEENKRNLEEAEKALEIFNNQINSLEIENTKTERELYRAAKDSEKIINDLVDEFKTNLKTLLTAIKAADAPNISTMITVLTGNHENYLTNIRIFEEKVSAYNKFMGKEAYNVTHEKMYMTEDQLEEVYRGIKTILNDMTEKKGKFRGFINNVKYQKRYQTFLNGLSAYAEDKEKYKEMVGRVDKELSDLKINPADKEKAEAQAKIDTLLADMLEIDKKSIKEHKGLTSISKIGDKVDEITKDYTALSSKEKEGLKEAAKNKYKDMINKEFGQELFDAINVVNELKAMLITLQETDYNTPEFLAEYEKVKEFTNNPDKKSILKKANALFVFDEENLIIRVVFKTSKVNDLDLDIVPLKDKDTVKNILKTPNPEAERLKEARATLSTELVKLLGQDPKDLTPEKVESAFKDLLDTAYSDLSEENRKNLIAEFVAKYNEQVKTATPEEKVAAVLENLFETFKSDFKKGEINVRILKITVSVSAALEEFKLSSEELNTLLDKAKNDFEQMKEKEFGKDLLAVVEEIIKIRIAIAELEKIEYTDPSFKTKYESLLAKTKALKDLDAVKNLGISIVVDEENKTLNVEFKNPKIDDMKFDLVNQKVKDQMKGQKPPQKPEDEDFEKEKTAAIENYLRLLEELNNDIKELNSCNASIEAAAAISMDTIDSHKINDVIAKEKVALGFDASILNKKLELSNARAELRFKYNCYVTSIKEIKEAKTEKITFGKDYQEFVRYYDEMIVIAETKIKELNVERMAEHTPDSRADELTAQMKELVNYIEAVNSLINRRIVAASLENDIDIVNFLQTRRENKKAIREEIKQMLEAERIKKPPVNEAEEEQNLEANLKAVYEEWLSELQVAMQSNTIAVNEEIHKQRITEIINNSKAKRKYEIADNILREFEGKKTAMMAGKNEQDLRDEIADSFKAELLPVIDLIRNGADYTTDFENLCISASLTQKLETIINGSTVPTKTTILEDEKIKYLEKIEEVIKKEKIADQRNILRDINKHIFDIEKLEVNEDLEARIRGKFDTLIHSYNSVFGRVEIKYEIENNRISIHYPCSKFNGIAYGNEIKKHEIKAMSNEMYDKYIQMKQRRKEPEITEQELLNAIRIILGYSNNQKDFTIQVLSLEHPEARAEKILEELEKRGAVSINGDGTITKLMSYEEYTAKYHNINSIRSPKVETVGPKIIPNDIRVNNGKVLQFKSNNPQHISRLNGKILSGDAITISMVKNGLKIKYSENLREQLKALNAKLSLVKRDDYRRRTTRQIEADKEEQTIAFKKDIKDGFVPKDYKIQIRTDKLDEQGQKTRGTDLLYEMEIDEELSDELVRTMKR